MHTVLFYNKFIKCLYMFRALCVHHQEVITVLYSIWYHTPVGDCPVHVNCCMEFYHATLT